MTTPQPIDTETLQIASVPVNITQAFRAYAKLHRLSQAQAFIQAFLTLEAAAENSAMPANPQTMDRHHAATDGTTTAEQ